jgi:predicted transcriptional regulator
MQQTTSVTVRVKPEIAIRLKKLAESMDCSISHLAAEAIEEYLGIHEWQVQAIKEGISAVDCNETISFEEIKKMWEEKVEDAEC